MHSIHMSEWPSAWQHEHNHAHDIGSVTIIHNIRMAQHMGRTNTTMCMPGWPTVEIIHMSECPSAWQHKHNHVQDGPRYE